MAQWVQAPKLQAWQPHFTPGTKVKAEGETQLHKAVL